MKYFIAATIAWAAALINVHCNTAIRFFYEILENTTLKQQERVHCFCGKIELDDSYSVGLTKGKRGRGSAGKIAGFEILKRGGKCIRKLF